MQAPKRSRAVGIPSTVLVEHDREQMRARGLDPKLIPDEPFRFMRPEDMAARYGISIATLYTREPHAWCGAESVNVLRTLAALPMWSTPLVIALGAFLL